MTGVPLWFRGPPAKRDPLDHECGECGAPPGERCRYTKTGGAHLGAVSSPRADGSSYVGYVDNVIGEPMQRSHKGR